MSDYYGCSDGNCLLRVEPLRFHTDAGCSCLDNVPGPLRRAIQRKLWSLQRVINEQEADNERLRTELAANARMLARQCDLARQAEVERDVLRTELTQAVAALQALYDWRAPDACAPDYAATRAAATRAEEVLRNQPRPECKQADPRGGPMR